jgi:hypothetical protein
MVITDLIARHGLPHRAWPRWRPASCTRDAGADPAHRTALRAARSRCSSRPPSRWCTSCNTNGERAMYESLELRKACCAIRKLEPLARMLAGRSAWVTGLRREQSDTRAVVPFSEDRRPGPHQVQPAGRLDLGRRLALHRHERRALQPAARRVHAQHRLRALHPRHRRGRGFPRRPLVVGGREGQGMRPAREGRSSRGRRIRPDRRLPTMNAPSAWSNCCPSWTRPPRLAGGRSHLHPARDGGRLRAPRAAVLRRQGLLRGAAPGREGLQEQGTQQPERITRAACPSRCCTSTPATTSPR